MRRFLLACGLMSALVAGAENYIKEGTVWVLTCYPDMPDEAPAIAEERIEKCMDGDEEALGLFYTNSLGNTEFRAFIRTEGDKVFFKTKENFPDQWFLLYDFGLKEGESCEVYHLNTVKEYGKATSWTIVGGETRQSPYSDCKELVVSCGGGSGYWINGIGSAAGLESSTYYSWVGDGAALLEVTSDGERIYYNEKHEIRTSSVKHISEPGIPEIRLEGSELTVMASGRPERVSVHAADGTLIYSATGTGDDLRITLPEKGIYVVKAGEETRKVLVP